MTIQQVIDAVLQDSTGDLRFPPASDPFIIGDPNVEVKGIATTFMATVEVIRQAAALGANFIITHEPTWFTGRDALDWCAQDSVYLAKKKLLEDTGISIWRYHDHMHAAEGDRIYLGMQKTLGWENYVVPAQRSPWAYDIPPCTLAELAADLKLKLHMTALQVIGNPDNALV